MHTHTRAHTKPSRETLTWGEVKKDKLWKKREKREREKKKKKKKKNKKKKKQRTVEDRGGVPSVKLCDSV